MSEGRVVNLSVAELDQHVYRVMPEEFVLALFNDRTNVLSSIQNWKDKFENFQLQLGGVVEGETFAFGFKDDFAGQCWTSDSLSEAMWGIYANDPQRRYLRIRSTPRRLLDALVEAHPAMPQDTCFVGKVKYEREADLEAWLRGSKEISVLRFVQSLLLKRRAFRHESEVRILYLGDKAKRDDKGLYRYAVEPHRMITQIMADPSRDRRCWLTDKAAISRATGFKGEIKRSKIYDPPEWIAPEYG